MLRAPKEVFVPRRWLLGNNGAGYLKNTSLLADDLTGNELLRVATNELIHWLQKVELSNRKDKVTWLGYFKWLLLYLYWHLRYGYKRNPFEVDSRDWDENLKDRPPRYWEQIYNERCKT